MESYLMNVIMGVTITSYSQSKEDNYTGHSYQTVEILGVILEFCLLLKNEYNKKCTK